MSFLVKYPTLFILLFEHHLVLGEIYCVKDDNIYFKDQCAFTGIFTNESNPYFQPSAFEEDPVNVSSVIVRRSILPLLTDEFCTVFPNLKKLTVDESSLNRIQDGALSSCKSLTHFSINDNDVTEVSPHLFTNNPNITGINFSSNKLTFLDVKIFEPTKKVLHVGLSNNLLVHFDFRAMPLLQQLKLFWINDNNLLDFDEFAVLEKLPNLRDFRIEDNLLECRNLKLVLEVFKDTNVTITKIDNPRERSPRFLTQLEDGIVCLNRTEHLRASSYYLNEIQVGASSKNLSCLDDRQPDNIEKHFDHVIFIQFVSITLIFCSISMVIWHGIYWRKIVKLLFGDNAEYYYCNYFPANPQNVRKEFVKTND